MKLKEACYSLKLECALREYGFVEIGWKVVANAGIYFIEPIGLRKDCGPQDEALGFIMGEHMYAQNPGSVHYMFMSARQAFDSALLNE
jgi:hypothetical protein